MHKFKGTRNFEITLFFLIIVTSSFTTALLNVQSNYVLRKSSNPSNANP